MLFRKLRVLYVNVFCVHNLNPYKCFYSHQSKSEYDWFFTAIFLLSMYFILPVIYLRITWHTCGVLWQVCSAVPHLLPTVWYGRTYPSMCNSCLFTGPQGSQCFSDEVPVRLLNVCHQKGGQIYLIRWTKKNKIHWGCKRIAFHPSINVVLAYNQKKLLLGIFVAFDIFDVLWPSPMSYDKGQGHRNIISDWMLEYWGGGGNRRCQSTELFSLLSGSFDSM